MDTLFVLSEKSDSVSGTVRSPCLLNYTSDSQKVSLQCELLKFSDCRSTLNSLRHRLGDALLTLLDSTELHRYIWANDIQLRFQMDRLPFPFLSQIAFIRDNRKKVFRLRDTTSKTTTSIKSLGHIKYCEESGSCLGDSHFQFPLRGRILKILRTTNIGNSISARMVYWPVCELRVWGVDTVDIRPIGPGKILSFSAIGRDGAEVRMYHGNELYSEYIGIIHLNKDIKLGHRLGPDEIIGQTKKGDGINHPSFVFRMEKNGQYLDVSSKFGIATFNNAR